MQIGIDSFAAAIADPVTGIIPSAVDLVGNLVDQIVLADQGGLDVFGIPHGLTPIETAKRIKDQGALVSIPHPFARSGRSSLSRSPIMDILDLVDLIEGFNARTTSKSTTESGRAFAEEHGLIKTAVSDAHTLGELGHTYTELPEFDGTPQGFKQALTEATLVEHPAGGLVHLYSRFNRVRKKFSPTPLPPSRS